MRRLAAVAVTVAALAVGGTAVVTAPDEALVSGPIAVRGAVGDTLHGRIFNARVVSLALADRLETTQGRRVSTPGIWLVARVRVTPHLATVPLDASTVRAGDVSYAAYPTIGDLAQGLEGPGIPVEGDLVFELPRSVAEERTAQLVLDRGTLVPDQITVVTIHPDRIRRTDTITVERARLVGADSS